MRRDDRVIELLLELSATLGAPFPVARYVGYIRALQDVALDSLEFACVEAAKFWEYNTMPPPARLREYARLYRRPINQDLQRTAIPEGFVNDAVARQKLAELKAMLGINRLVFEDGGTC